MNGFSKVCIIKGAAFFNDKIDGEVVDSGSIFIEEVLDDSTGRARGVRTVEYRTPGHELAKAACAHELPAQFEVSFEVVTSKRGQAIKIAGFKPFKGQQPQPTPQPRAA